MATTTYAGLSNEQRTMYELVMLKRAVPNFPHLAFGQSGVHNPTTLPNNKGAQIQWRKLGSFTAVTTPLSGDATPDSQDISITKVTGTVSEYGAYIRYGRSISQFGIDQVAAEASDALGEQAGDSLDLITRAAIVTGTTVQFADDATDTNEVASTDVLKASEILEAVATLKTNNAVAPLASGMYPAIIHPKTEFDCFQDAVWQAVLSYSKDRGEDNPWTKGYIGDAFGVSYYCSSNAYVESGAGAGAIDVYHTLILGKQSFGIGGLAAYMPDVMAAQMKENNTFQNVRPLQLIDHPFGAGGTSDPLNQRATIGWYTTFVSKILEESFMNRIEHAASLG